MKTKEEVIAILHELAATIAGFDGVLRGLLLINDKIMELHEEEEK